VKDMTTQIAADSGEVCCALGGEAEISSPTVLSRRSRCARAVVGVAFLGIAGALAPRRARGRIALWPAALVSAWFGASHLVAAQIGYPGCPELGAIPSVLHGRTIATRCRPWQETDRWLERW
jgi:hypothetical protein